MRRSGIIFRLQDHAAAWLAVLATAHIIGLIELAGWLPHGTLALPGPAGMVMAVGLCGLTYAVVLAALHRRRLIKGALYRCAETRPPGDFGKAYQRGDTRLLDSWHYR